MLKLWGRANSSNVQKVIWTLEELGLRYERIDVGGAFGGTGTPAYRAMNPLGVVPSLQDGRLALFESNAICRYLCRAHAPESQLYPEEAGQRARVEMWMDFQQTALSRPQSIVFQGLVRTPPERRDCAAIAAASAELSGIWRILDGRLAEQPYIALESFTLADITFGMHAHRWLQFDIPDRPELEHLRAWYQRLCERPAFARNVAEIPIT